MGRDLALQAAGRGYTVLGCSSSPVATLRQDDALAALLDAGSLHYQQVDVAEQDQVAVLAQRYADITGGQRVEQLDVIANAGIARWGDPENAEEYTELQRMWAINVEGTRHLAEAMRDGLSAADRSAFVAMSSIVAAEGRAIAGNVRYMATKLAVQHYVTGTLVHDPRFSGVRSFAVAPGVVPTPMIMDELLLPLIFRAALVETRGNPGFAATLASFIPEGQSANAAQLCENSPAQNVRVLFGDLLASDEKLARLQGALDDDPELTRRALASFMRNARRDGPMRDRVLAVLYALDLAVRPEVVAEKILDQLAGADTPRKRVLKVYSKGGGNPILKLMQTL